MSSFKGSEGSSISGLNRLDRGGRGSAPAGLRVERPGQDFAAMLDLAKGVAARRETIEMTGGKVLESVVRQRLRDIEKEQQRGDTSKDDARNVLGVGKLPDSASLEKTAIGEAGTLGSIGAQKYLEILNQTHAHQQSENMKYLQVQQHFMLQSRTMDTISNLLKVRNEAVSRTVRGSQG